MIKFPKPYSNVVQRMDGKNSVWYLPLVESQYDQVDEEGAAKSSFNIKQKDVPVNWFCIEFEK